MESRRDFFFVFRVSEAPKKFLLIEFRIRIHETGLLNINNIHHSILRSYGWIVCLFLTTENISHPIGFLFSFLSEHPRDFLVECFNLTRNSKSFLDNSFDSSFADGSSRAPTQVLRILVKKRRTQQNSFTECIKDN